MANGATYVIRPIKGKGTTWYTWYLEHKCEILARADGIFESVEDAKEQIKKVKKIAGQYAKVTFLDEPED